MISFSCRDLNTKTNRNRLISTENKLVVGRGEWVGRTGQVGLRGTNSGNKISKSWRCKGKTGNIVTYIIQS